MTKSWYYSSYPRTVSVITVHARGINNVFSAAWHTGLSHDPPIYGVVIGPKRYSYELILEAGEFAVHFLPLEKAELIAAVGGCSGRDVNKFDAFRIPWQKAKKIKAPILEDAYVAYECNLIDHKPYGDHVLFAGEIVHFHLNERKLGEKGQIDIIQTTPAIYGGGDLFYAPSPGSVRSLDRYEMATTLRQGR